MKCRAEKNVLLFGIFISLFYHSWSVFLCVFMGVFLVVFLEKSKVIQEFDEFVWQTCPACPRKLLPRILYTVLLLLMTGRFRVKESVVCLILILMPSKSLCPWSPIQSSCAEADHWPRVGGNPGCVLRLILETGTQGSKHSPCQWVKPTELKVFSVTVAENTK